MFPPSGQHFITMKRTANLQRHQVLKLAFPCVFAVLAIELLANFYVTEETGGFQLFLHNLKVGENQLYDNPTLGIVEQYHNSKGGRPFSNDADRDDSTVNENLIDTFLSKLADPSYTDKITVFASRLFWEFKHLKDSETVKSSGSSTSKNGTNAAKSNGASREDFIKLLQRMEKFKSYPHFNHLDLFIKQMSRAKRFERCPVLRASIDKLVDRFATLSYSNSGKTDTSKTHPEKKRQKSAKSASLSHNSHGAIEQRKARQKPRIAKLSSNSNNQQQQQQLNITIIFNAFNEINNLDALIEYLGSCSDKDWMKPAKLIVALSPINEKRVYAKLSNLKTVLRDFDWFVVKEPSLINSVVGTLAYITLRVSTEYVLFTRRFRKMDPNFDLYEFTGPLYKQTANMVAGTVILKNGKWESGCFQARLMWSQLIFYVGYDKHRSKVWIQCDVTDSPFALKRSVASSMFSLQQKKTQEDANRKKKAPKPVLNSMNSSDKGGGKSPKNKGNGESPEIKTTENYRDSVYLQFFHTARFKYDYVIKTHLMSSFYIDNDDVNSSSNKNQNNKNIKNIKNSSSNNNNNNNNDYNNNNSGQSATFQLSRKQWQHFASTNDAISDIWLPSSGAGGGRHFEFTWREVGVQGCNAKSNMLNPRACMQLLHNLLLNSYRLFDRLGYQFSTEDGSGLGAAKLHGTLPWELDHDFSFRTQNMTDLMRHQKEFGEIGIYLKPSFVGKACLNKTDLSDVSTWRCGYVALRGAFWRLEAWGQRTFSCDVYQPNTIPKLYRDQFPNSRIRTPNFTRIRIGDFWSQTIANPGYYARARYGQDSLRHAQHWALTDGESGWSDYRTTPRFAKCPEEGHHLCLDQYLADGNIQFQKPWA